jgi:eukaryotic-like serine/threonine-protein kinase
MAEPAHRLPAAPSVAATEYRPSRLEVRVAFDAALDRWHAPRGLRAELASLLGLPPASTETWAEAAPSPSARSTVFAEDGPAARPGALPVDDRGNRYEDLGLIGLGGMGEVRRVRDRRLGRVVAMKIIRAEYKRAERALSRFLEEAQVSAQLEHPAIVPVHDLGRLPDGRVYFTMQEVRGHTLGEIIQALHRASAGERWAPSPTGWTLRRLVEAFRRVCDAVAYAHARGVLHRDLKPDNIMLGSFGEVLVMDWGLAKLRDEPDSILDPVDVADDGLGHTRVGTVAGTPAYMAPEQARGELDRLDARADVYALGALLYEILDGAPPFTGKDALDQVLAGPPRPLGGRAAGRRHEPGPPIPRPLRQICQRAMARLPDDRFPDAGALGDALADWLDGARKREQALEHVRRAETRMPAVRDLERRAGDLHRRATDLLTALPPGAGPAEKRQAWQLQDQAEKLELQAELANVEVMQHLRAALSEAPDTAEAHRTLAAHYRERHARAEARRDRRGQAALEALLRAHDTGEHAAYLAGRASLRLATVPPAQAHLRPVVERDRRLVDGEPRALGATPLLDIPVGHGSYTLELVPRDGPAVHVPIHLARGEAWALIPPDAETPLALDLPEDLAEDEAWVAPGWAWIGGDALAPGAGPRQRVWVDGVVLRRRPVTWRDYLAFLHHLVEAEGLEVALRHAPRVGGVAARGREGLRVRLDGGGFTLLPGIAADAPVTFVDHGSARAFAAWEASRTGRPWRLPTELEWEKAARGVDGRVHPWGDFLDPAFCRTRTVHRHARTPDPVDDWPVDRSPYGVLGLAGNSRDWCLDAHDPAGPPVVDGRAIRSDPAEAAARSVRGGSFTRDGRAARVAARDWEPPETRAMDLGFRLARDAAPS